MIEFKRSQVIRGEVPFRTKLWLTVAALVSAVVLGVVFVGWTYMVDVEPDFGDFIAMDS